MPATDPSFTRRAALKTGTLAVLSLPFIGARSAVAAEPAPARPRTSSFTLGLASYSFSTLTADQALTIIRELEIKTVSLHSAHAPWPSGTVEQCRAAVQKFTDAGVEVTSTGVIDLPNDEAVVRKAFENVHGAGLPMMAGRPAPAAFPLVEKFVKETGVKVAVHNHGPSDIYPTVASVIQAIRPYDPRIGLCVDIGHAWQSGEDPATAIRAFPERLYEVHLWDTSSSNDGKNKRPVPVPMGHGLLNVRAVIEALNDIHYSHHAELEYLERTKDKATAVAESIGYLRGLVAVL